MSVQLTMPQLGESVTEGRVVRWLKQEGDPVEKYAPVVEIETDKVVAEVPSPVAGALATIVTAEGTTVLVGSVLAVIEEASVPAVGQVRVATGVGAGAGSPQPDGTRVPEPLAIPQPPEDTADQAEEAPERARRHFTPVVLKLAAQHQIDLDQITGTGIGGRVTKQDVLAYLEQREAGGGVGVPTVEPVAPRPAEPTVAVRPAEPVVEPAARHEAYPVPGPRDERLPLTPVRRQIAEHLSRSTSEIPHAGGTIEVDVTNLVRLRKELQGEFERLEGIPLTYLPFVVKATIAGLKKFPLLNSQWGGDCIILKRDVNISIAVALEESLMVPVIHNADGLSLVGIARAAADLASRAREGRLRVEDVQGGTFTVNNTGALGTVLSKPIINHPQAAILTSEAIVRRPVVAGDGSIVVRSMMNMCISFDHRIMDGLVVSKFLKCVRDQLESPAQLVL